MKSIYRFQTFAHFFKKLSNPHFYPIQKILFAFLLLLFPFLKVISQLPCGNSFPYSGITIETVPGYNGVTPSMSMGKYMPLQSAVIM